MERYFLIVLLVLMLASGLMACSNADSEGQGGQAAVIQTEPTESMPTLTVPTSSASPSPTPSAHPSPSVSPEAVEPSELPATPEPAPTPSALPEPAPAPVPEQPSIAADYIYETVRIEEPVAVPEFVADTPEPVLAEGEKWTPHLTIEPETSRVGGVLEGSYVHAPAISRFCDGMGSDPFGIYVRNGFFYGYEAVGNELIRQERHHLQGNYTVLGNEFHLDLDWVVQNGGHGVAELPGTLYREMACGWGQDVPAAGEHAVLMFFECDIPDPQNSGQTVHTRYPAVLDLESGMLMDVLAGTGAESLPNIWDAIVSEDGMKMVLIQGEPHSEPEGIYLVDLVSKELHDVEKLSAQPVSGCTLVGDTLICWEEMYDVLYRVWQIDLSTLVRTDVTSEWKGLSLVQGLNSGWGLWTAGSRWALETDKKTGAVYAFDLLTGERGLIEGLSKPWKNETWQFSPDGKKLLVGLAGEVSRIGIVDFEQQRYVTFSVEYGDAEEISGFEWIGNDRVALSADNAAQEDLYHTHPHHYFIYRFLA